MKEKEESILIISFILTIFLLITPFSQVITKNHNSTNRSRLFDDNFKSKNPKMSDFWEFTVDPIIIEGNATGLNAHNWKWATEQDWCYGSGTWNDPYIIENIIINSQGIGNCIEIINSSVYAIIRNCSLYNSGGSDNSIVAGIKLSMVANITLFNNTLYSNLGHGLLLEYSINCKILNNTVVNNQLYGIKLSNSDNNTISGNIMNNNTYGIDLSDSSYNNVSRNNINSINRGLLLTYGKNNSILGNTIICSSKESSGSERGIYISHSSNITVSGNFMYNCGLYVAGYLIEISSYYIDKTNKINSKILYFYKHKNNLGKEDFSNAGQVILINCTHSLISNLTISYTHFAIFLYFSNNNTIINNTLSNNYCSIYVRRSHANTISGNIINKSDCVVTLSQSNYNNISANILNNNDKFASICLYSNYNHFTGNIANHNHICISVSSSSNYNIISGNIINNSDYAIDVHSSDHNTIINNNLSKNKYSIKLSGSDNNPILGNKIDNSIDAVQLYHSDSNNISENTLKINVHGIILNYSYYNTVVGNILVGNVFNIAEDNYCLSNIIVNNDCYTKILPAGINQFEIEPYNVENIDISITIALNNETKVFFSAFDGNPTIKLLDNAFLFLNLFFNETDNLNNVLKEVIIITINCIFNTYNNIKVLWFNQTADDGTGVWEKIPSTALSDGLIQFSSNYTMFFSLIDESIPPIPYSTTSFKHDDNDINDGIDVNNEIDIKSILIYFIIFLFLALFSSAATSYYITNKKTNKALRSEERRQEFIKLLEKSPSHDSKDFITELYNYKTLLQKIKIASFTESILPLKNIHLTFVSRAFLKKVDNLNLLREEKIEFLNEMLALSPDLRNKIVNKMLKRQKLQEINQMK